MSLTGCLNKAGKALQPGDRREILARAAALRRAGAEPSDAGRQAIKELLAKVEAELKAAAAAAKTAKDEEQAAGRPKRTASGMAKHPATVMGSRMLADVSRALDGLDPTLLSEYSTRFETTRIGKDGRPIITWRNPLIPGVGRLFRRGGRQDREEIARTLEDYGYLEPGSVDRDSKEAGERAKDLIKAALNREEVQSLDEQEAGWQAAQDAERRAAEEQDAEEAARELEEERLAITAEAGLQPSEVADLPDSLWETSGSTDTEATMRALGFTEQEIADELAREAEAAGAGQGEAARAVPQGPGQAEAAREDRDAAARREGGGAEAGLTANEPDAQYQTDLFGNDLEGFTGQLPAARRASGGAQQPRAATAERRDLDATGEVRRPEGRFGTVARVVTQRNQQLGHVGPIRGLGDAAAALAYLGRSAVERLDGLLTDSAGNPLAVVGGFKGALSQTSVYPSTLVGEAFQVPKAARLWLVHNHPSGESTLSRADSMLLQAIDKVFQGTEIKVMGMIAVGDGRWSGERVDGALDAGRLATAQGPTVPAQERELQERGMIGPAISSPQEASELARDLVRQHGGAPGILLLDVQLNPTAFVPWAADEAIPLKNNGRLDALYRAVSFSNAGGAIIATGDAKPMSLDAARNLAKGLDQIDVRVLDIVPQQGKTVAQEGLPLKAPVLFSRSQSTKSAYEKRVDELFAGEAAAGPRDGVRVLDRSDMLSFLGFGEGPVQLAEGKVRAGQRNHPHMTAEVWKQIPTWLDNPAAVFDSDTDGGLVFIAPDLVDGRTVRLIVEPAAAGGANVHVLINAYDASQQTPFARWFQEGLARYVHTKELPAVLQRSGRQLPSSAWQNKPGAKRILSERQFDGWKRANGPAFSQGMSPELAQRLSTIRVPATTESVRAAVRSLVNGIGMMPNSLGRVVVATSAEIKREWQPLIGDVTMESEQAGDAMGFYDPKSKTVFLIADRIPEGQERAVAMHELMHKHGRAVLGADGWNKLHGAIAAWAKAPEGSTERRVHDEATAAVRDSRPTGDDEGAYATEELFPYAVQSAMAMGIEPNLLAKPGSVAHWLGQVRKALRELWTKVFGKSKAGEFTTQDMVNLAFAVAQRENPAHRGELDAAAGDGEAADQDRRYSFAGPYARTADIHALAVAEQRLKRGDDAEAVRQDSGWFKGTDGKWRFEINDADAKLRRVPDAETPLGEVLDHPALFAAYPGLAGAPTTIEVGEGKPAKGRLSRSTGAITVSAPTKVQALSILLHEVQHGIQNLEGFGRGGDKAEFARDLPDGGWDNGFQRYFRLAGEVEARNTQTRQALDANARRAIPPSMTADVAEADVIVRFNGEDAESAPPPANAGGGGGRRGGAASAMAAAEPEPSRRKGAPWFRGAVGGAFAGTVGGAITAGPVGAAVGAAGGAVVGAIGARSFDATNRAEFSPGAWLFRALGRATDPLWVKLQMKAASPEMRRQLRRMKLDIQRAQETSVAVARDMQALPEAERLMVSDIIEREVAAGIAPPQHAVRLAAVMTQAMSAQSAELVRLGMLSEEAAKRWDGAYLPRFYESKLRKQVGDAWADAARRLTGRPQVMKGIGGKHLKGRGLYETIPEADLPHYEAMGWEVRDPDYQPNLPTVDGTVQVWRDYTRAEREKMGEIRDAGFRFVMGYMQTQRDIALGRMFEGLAKDPAVSSRTPREGWVRVPDGTVEGTGAKRYGMLAGRYVPMEVLSHLSQIDEAQSAAWAMYRKALGIWKMGKTAMNPVSHMNNVLSNLTMAHFAGVSYHRTDKYLGAIRDFITKPAMLKEAKDNGLFLATMSSEELVKDLPPELRDLAMKAESATMRGAKFTFDIFTFRLRKPLGKAYEQEDLFFRYLLYKDARERGLQPQDAVDHAQRYIFTYDDLPKGARYIRDFGIPFFSYTYKAMPALLHTALVYPWRFAAPAGVLWAANAIGYALAADDDDDWQEALRKYLTDEQFREKAREKEKAEREHLPSWMKGTTALLTPKAIRLGTDEVTSLPLFIDVARIVPGGDTFDVSPNAGGLPLPQPLTPSHPLLTIAMGMIGNKDTFTGREIASNIDTSGEAALKRSEWLWKQIAPATAIGSYHWERTMSALAQATGEEVRWTAALPDSVEDKIPEAVSKIYTGIGRDGLPVQPGYAAMQTFGLKVRPLDLEMSEQIEGSMRDKMIRDIDAELRRMRRLEGKGAISERTLDREREKAQVKKDRLRDGLTVDGTARD